MSGHKGVEERTYDAVDLCGSLGGGLGLGCCRLDDGDAEAGSAGPALLEFWVCGCGLELGRGWL